LDNFLVKPTTGEDKNNKKKNKAGKQPEKLIQVFLSATNLTLIAQ
jgi:hypothetical protein